MKIQKVYLAIMASGFILAISSWVRYFVLYPDLDKAFMYGMVGLLLALVGWLHHLTSRLSINQLALQEWVQDKWNEDNDGQ